MILDPILLGKRVHIDLRGAVGDLVQQGGEAIGTTSTGCWNAMATHPRQAREALRQAAVT
ncbi:MAG: hypothetical protein M3N43_14930 [Actinomycetota bacterium]|nr:hypothetical protein [Actinomycetota bacterium]